MGASLGGAASGSGRKRRKPRKAPIAEINMTPFIDVVLVLLIIFMVAAPLLTAGVPLDLPQSEAKALNQDTEPVAVSVSAKGEIFVQDAKVELDDLVAKLNAIAKLGPEERIFVRADKGIDYGRVMQVMGRISGAGFAKVALVTEQEN